MFPSRSMTDYMSEIQRLFPDQRDEDVRGQPRLFNNQARLFHSPPHWPNIANHSSSSTDSTSPDTFPDLLQRRFDSQFRKQRPIVGRKILASSVTPPKMEVSRSYESEYEFSPPSRTWQQEDFSLYNMTPKRTPTPYELFPENDVGFMSITPKRTSPMSPPSFHTNPSSSNYSPNKYLETPPRSYQRFPKPPMMAFNSAQSHKEETVQKMCTFCRKNGETPMVYMNHTVRGKIGNRNIVTCPILRSHVCATCGSSGDNAHTITYCPVLRSNNNGQPLQSTTITLKNTRIKSNGMRRY